MVYACMLLSCTYLLYYHLVLDARYSKNLYSLCDAKQEEMQEGRSAVVATLDGVPELRKHVAAEAWKRQLGPKA
jgi:hypothetical protein